MDRPIRFGRHWTSLIRNAFGARRWTASNRDEVPKWPTHDVSCAQSGSTLLSRENPWMTNTKWRSRYIDWSWSHRRTALLTGFRESDATKQTSVSPITVEKRFDKASTALAKYCANGKHIPEGIDHVPKAMPANRRMHEFLMIDLKDVKVERVAWGGRGDAILGIPETVELSFLKFSIYTLCRTTRPAHGCPSIFNFDVGHHKRVKSRSTSTMRTRFELKATTGDNLQRNSRFQSDAFSRRSIDG